MRTDSSFRRQQDVDHHRGTSVLVDLPLDTVRDIPVDYMHLVLLGVVKKLLMLWLTGPLSIRLGPLERKLMNEASENLKLHIPIEFSRKTRPVTEVERWKAAELRLFLFYTGPLILKSVLSPKLYDNFTVLHSSLSILANNELCSQHADYAGALLRHFVHSFTTIYGEEHVSYNVHCLIHLAEDVKFHGPVDTFSAFPFENNMRHIKKELRKHKKPLQQLRNRMLERLQLPHVFLEGPTDFELIRPQDTGPLPPDCTGPEFGAARCGTFLLSGSTGNNCVMLDGHIILVQKFCYLKSSNEICIVGQEFNHREDFYTSPFESSRIGIFLVSTLSRNKVWPLRNPKKMLLLPHASQYIVLPEIHTN
nr:uncharacterized protein LOC126518484 [Dermacentor andersoni]